MDVRCLSVATSPKEIIISGSRDRTAKVWSTLDSTQGFVEISCLRGHTNFVSCICMLPPDDDHPTGLILTGSNDKSICAFTLENPDPVYRLVGHNNTVCALVAGKFGTVVSGSWDYTAKVWIGQKCMMTLQGHDAAVWCVAMLSQQGATLTGSADKTIKMWKAGECKHTFLGHTDCVRALLVASEVEFLSASNDGSIRKWLITGECVSVFESHESYVYSIALLPNGVDFVSSGEDRTLRVWKNGNCSQTIRLPTQSIWAVATLPNGDIITGSGDGIVRVFTSSPERQASIAELKAFEEEVANSTLSTGDVGNIKLNELPGREVLYEPGKRDGQNVLVREGSKVTVYQWSADESRWLKIGDMLGSSGAQAPGTKIHFEGKEYDYVFDVDIQEGHPPLKLPYNATEDPWFAAQKFIQHHNLSQMFLDQVANFIIKNTSGMTLNAQQSGSFDDPFTGQSRYIPGNSSSTSMGGTDPFTGSGRYVPSYNQDLTTSSSVPATTSMPTSIYFPHKSFLCFEMANLGAIQNKIREFNTDISTGELKMEDNVIDEVLKLTDTSVPSTILQLEALDKLLQWPQDIIFPVLDILRLAIRNPTVNRHYCKVPTGTNFITYLLKFLNRDVSGVHHMLCLRILFNMFGQPSGEALAVQHRDVILDAAQQLFPSDNKNVQIAFATLLLNYAVLLIKCADFEAKCQCLSSIANVLNVVNDREAQFRLLVAIGTLIWNDSDSLAVARSLEMLPFISQLKTVTNPKKVGECAIDVSSILN